MKIKLKYYDHFRERKRPELIYPGIYRDSSMISRNLKRDWGLNIFLSRTLGFFQFGKDLTGFLISTEDRMTIWLIVIDRFSTPILKIEAANFRLYPDAYCKIQNTLTGLDNNNQPYIRVLDYIENLSPGREKCMAPNDIRYRLFLYNGSEFLFNSSWKNDLQSFSFKGIPNRYFN